MTDAAPEVSLSTDTSVSPAGLRALRDLAFEALRDVAPDGTVGDLVAVTGEGEVREVTFASSLPGYLAWRWTVEVAVLPDLAPSVLEVALLPGDEALVAPQWVPWADRLADYQRLHPDDVHDLPDGLDDDADEDDVDEDDLDEDLEIADPDEFEVADPSDDEIDAADEPDGGMPESDDAAAGAHRI